MDTEQLIEQMTKPSAYPHPVDGDIVVHQTHISVVFLAGEYAYKFKKPVDLGFLDYSTLEKRKHFCEREVELNRRLAPKIYLNTVPVTMSGASGGDLSVGGGDKPAAGAPKEWAVKMVRLPDKATLEARLGRDEVTAGQIESLARHIASFHARAERGDEVSRFARFEAVAKNARDNFKQSTSHVGETIHQAVFDRLSTLTDDRLEEVRELIERRAAADVACDTHGDLRLDHVYLFDGEFVIVDCIEFNDAFRFADPVADIAFLAMDLEFDDRRDLARALVAEYLEAADDRQGAELVAFYIAYRAAVRAKVEGIKATETEVGLEAREQATQKARAHWLLALGRLEAPRRRPAMVLVGGLPGTGKSTLARALARRAGFEVIDTDVVRKELAGLDPHETGRAEYGDGIYTPEWSEKTYEECLRRAEELLFEGKRVIVDASFSSEARRKMFLESGRGHGVRTLFLECETSAETARERLAERSEDVSDADWGVYRKMVEAWDEPSEATERVRRGISAEGEIETVVERALEELRGEGLL